MPITSSLMLVPGISPRTGGAQRILVGAFLAAMIDAWAVLVEVHR